MPGHHRTPGRLGERLDAGDTGPGEEDATPHGVGVVLQLRQRRELGLLDRGQHIIGAAKRDNSEGEFGNDLLQLVTAISATQRALELQLERSPFAF